MSGNLPGSFRLRCITLGSLCFCLGGVIASTGVLAQPEAPVYEQRSPSRDGIGKFYFGREIAFVMGHLAADWLDRPEREREEGTDLLLENLPLEPGQRVADIGAGTGYFTLPMAAAVGPKGIAYAVDIQPEMLEMLSARAAAAGVDNIVPVLATERDPGLQPGSIDLALFVDAYHEFEWPFEVMSAIYSSLVPGGQVILVEYRAEDPGVMIKPLHKMTVRQARRELEAVGFEFVANRRFLPQQHFLVFAKPEN